MATYKTPGVFIEEISTLGSSIAGVPTAITGFVGYTEQALFLDGTSAANIPVRITSLLEFQQIFGGPFHEKFQVTLSGSVFGTNTIATTPKSFITPDRLSNYILFYQVQMFYANGGGTCWVVSVGTYSAAPTLTPTLLTDAIDKFEQIDEVTLLVAPESVFLTVTGNRKVVYDHMAIQCAKLQDRFAVLDVVHNGIDSIFTDASNFRNNDIGANNLKYVGAYYPALNTPTGYFFNDADVAIVDNRPYTGTGPYNGKNLADINSKSLILVQSSVTVSISAGGPLSPGPTADDFEIIIPSSVSQVFSPNGGTSPGDYSPGGTDISSIAALVLAINNDSVISQFVLAEVVGPITFTLTAKLVGAIGDGYSGNYAATSRFSGTSPAQFTSILNNGIPADIALYNRIKTELAKYTLTLYPSATMTGVYAQVDADRGVWKAPANVGLTLVNQPSIQITDDDQQDLNVDSVSGKSINAIRTFTGRGVLVWGSRTLAGNDNEWRYINVRRLFTYVEASAKKATEFVVFEANTANTWQRVKGMIEAFLTGLWRDGALAGATPKDAFFVNVGLGITMTAQDILDGKMIVEIGMAAARPAEFIILRFSHKLQES